MAHRNRHRPSRRVVVGCAAAALAAATFAGEKRAHALFMPAGAQSWPGGVVPVCIDSSLESKPNYDRFYAVLRTNVENTWARAANIRFTGWGTCPSPWPAGTAVLYYEPGGFNADVGYHPSAPTTFKVDFNYNGRFGNNSTPARWADVVVHEFGHLLGFHHEQNRADNPFFASTSQGCSQVDSGWPQPGEVDITPYDQNSIMNYCGIGAIGYATQQLPGLESDLAWFQPISAWDVAGVQGIYGQKPAGSLVGLGARCANVFGDRPDWGSQLIAYDCTGYENDTWSRALGGVDLTFVAHPGGNAMAIDVPGASLRSGFTPLWDYPPNNSVAQQFTFTGMQWKAFGDMCVVPDASAAGAALRVQTCTGSNPLEQWDFEPTGRIRLSGTSLCTNVPHASASVGNVMQLWPCGWIAPYPNEVFVFTDRGEIEYGGLCMNVWRGNMAPGSPIALYACGGAAGAAWNERFHMTGSMHGEGGECLETFAFPGGYSENGQQVGLDACGGEYAQTWDYYFLGRR